MTTDTTAPFAGPRNRESFFDAQRRNRRATWRLSAMCVLATIVMGIPLALTITPLLYAGGLLIAEIVSIWMPLPASFWQRSMNLPATASWQSSGSARDNLRIRRPS